MWGVGKENNNGVEVPTGKKKDIVELVPLLISGKWKEDAIELEYIGVKIRLLKCLI